MDVQAEIRMPDRGVAWRVATPASTSAAIALIELTGDAESLDRGLAVLGIQPVSVGRVALRNIAGIDLGVVARLSSTCVHLMPHGGVFIVRAVAAELRRHFPAGEITTLDEVLVVRRFPEAFDRYEAWMLEMLGRAASTRAVDLLLDQPRRWREHERGELPGPDAAFSRELQRLIEPPTVATLGASNIGKSTLVNALARRSVSIVADEMGTTRDHVGVMLDVDGLTVRFIDTPGLRSDAPHVEARAWELTRRVLEGADLLLACGDHRSPAPDTAKLGLNVPTVLVQLRSDLGGPGDWTPDITTAAAQGLHVDELARLVRRTLVSDAALEDPRPWAFWPSEGP
jgi:small GTP-binding protein